MRALFLRSGKHPSVTGPFAHHPSFHVFQVVWSVMLLRLAPFLFVLFWSSGFIANKVVSGHGEPFTLLVIRFGFVLTLFGLWIWWTKPQWPTRSEARQAALTGVLIHGMYLGGMLFALRSGMPAGIAAIVGSTQPILTAVLAGPLLGDWPGRRHWSGLVLGMIGVLLVLWPRLGIDPTDGGLGFLSIAGVTCALAGITLGTLNQKKHGMSGDLVVLTAIQYVSAFTAALILALGTETMVVQWTGEFVLAMLWLVTVLSIGAISLLLMMIRASAVSKVTSLFYLIPAVTAVMAAMFFGEILNWLQLFGIVLVMVAVFLIRSPTTAAAATAHD